MRFVKIIICAIIILVPFKLALAKTIEVPFSSQAPYGDWSEPWQNACEEMGMVMVDYFYKGEDLSQKDAYDSVLELFDFKNENFGISQSQTADEVIELINAYFDWRAYRADDPSIEQIKEQIDLGRPVIVPCYGRGLGNPYYTAPGPVYHILIIKGYDDEKRVFITNDQGTRRGENYRYGYQNIMANVHDYLPNDQTPYGDKVVIFTLPPGEEIEQPLQKGQTAESDEYQLDFEQIEEELISENEGEEFIEEQSSENQMTNPEAEEAVKQVPSNPNEGPETGFWVWLKRIWGRFLSLFR